jgi:hypothetical protein
MRFRAAFVLKIAKNSIYSNNLSLKQISNRLRRALIPAFAEN